MLNRAEASEKASQLEQKCENEERKSVDCLSQDPEVGHCFLLIERNVLPCASRPHHANCTARAGAPLCVSAAVLI